MNNTIKKLVLPILTSAVVITSCITPAPGLPTPPSSSLSNGRTIRVNNTNSVSPVPLSTSEVQIDALNTEPPEITEEMQEKEDTAKKGESIATLLPGTIDDSTVSVEKRSDFTKSIAVYDYVDGIIYTVYCSPGHATDLRLEEGEEVITSPVLGDASRWDLATGQSVQNGKTINHIFIRANASDVSTTLILATNKRTYYLKLISFETIYMFALQFRYPSSSLSFSSSSSTLGLPDNTLSSSSVPENGLNFDFLIEKRQKDYPSWKPTSVYSDNKRTYLQLSPYFKDSIQAPSIYFIKNYENENDMSVVNYSVKDTLYIVDFTLTRGEALMLISGNDKVKVTKL